MKIQSNEKSQEIKFRMIAIFTWTAVISIIYFSSLFTEFPQIDLRNCNPDGSIAKLKRAYDPLRFSVRQHLAAEEYFTSDAYKEAINMCSINFRDDAKLAKECLVEITAHGDRVYACYKFWTDQCNANGGHCQMMQNLKD